MKLRQSSAVSGRSVLLGSAAVAGMCGLTPFNDYIVENTWMSGSYLPVGVALIVFVLVVLVNAPLYRVRPRWALRPGELAVIVAMLALSAVPAQGISRALVPTLVVPFHLGQYDQSFWDAFLRLGLPRWMFPVQDFQQGRSELVVTAFFSRLADGQSLPWSVWVVPLLGWGVFVAGLWAALLGLAAILRYQWAESERLPFPLAQVQAALIEAPSPGRSLNATFGSAAFWAGLGAVFAARNVNALAQYFPRHVPEIPLGYDLRAILSNAPWAYLSNEAKVASLYFIYLGIAYFIQARVAFSLWMFFLLKELVTVQARSVQSDVSVRAWNDQHMGASLALLVGVIWIGRQHWGRVLRQMFGRGPHSRGDPPEPTGWYVPYWLAGWLVVGGVAVMSVWLLWVGVGVAMTALIVAVLLAIHVVTARVVAQTGLAAFRTTWLPTHVYTSLPPGLWSARDVFFGGAWTMNGPMMSRETPMPFMLHGMQVFEQTAGASTADGSAPPPSNRDRRRLVWALAWALVLGSGVSAWASLRMYYAYASPLTPGTSELENRSGLEQFPDWYIRTPLRQHRDGRWPPQPHNPWVHVGIGASLTAMLQVASLRYAAWPLSPVGYLVSSTWYIRQAWFSILLGWLAKVLIVKYGGARVYERARPLFIGLVFGEVLAAGVWMVITLVFAQMGLAYKPVRMLPD